MSVASFLSGLTYGGKSLNSNVDPLSGGMTTLNTPFMFGQVLKQAAAPGGALSQVTADRTFASQVQAMANQQRGMDQEYLAQMQDAGVESTFARRALAEQPYRLASQATALRGQLEGQRSMLELEAMSNLANVTAESAAQQKSMQLQKYMFEKALREQKKANKFGKVLGIASLGLSALSLPIGGTSLFGKMFGGGSSSGTGMAAPQQTPQASFNFGGFGGFGYNPQQYGYPGVPAPWQG